MKERRAFVGLSGKFRRIFQSGRNAPLLKWPLFVRSACGGSRSPSSGIALGFDDASGSWVKLKSGLRDVVRRGEDSRARHRQRAVGEGLCAGSDFALPQMHNIYLGGESGRHPRGR